MLRVARRFLAFLVLLVGVLFLIILVRQKNFLYDKSRFTALELPTVDDAALATMMGDNPANSTHRTTQGEKLLGIASRVYVLSLPTRHDRRRDMEQLSKTLSVHTGVRWNWTYVDAVPKEAPVITRIMDFVRRLRRSLAGAGVVFESLAAGSGSSASTFRFVWPKELLSSNEGYKQLVPDLFLAEPPLSSPSPSHLPEPMVCATQNVTITPYAPTLPHYRILTSARVACWHSHVSLIRTIANDDTLDTQETVVVLEDDVDMEIDIGKRLKRVWRSLPREWDLVYLGHCWSNEAFHPALDGTYAEHTTVITTTTIATTPYVSHTRIHPSKHPLCTHAYALSRSGARRILLHLQYPPFAYSRSIDKALAWLIQNGRVKSFSVVPSVVIQRKTVKSDVMPGRGSVWKDILVNGVFG